MRYLSDSDVRTLFTSSGWGTFIDVIESTLHTLERGDFAQPLKPYLRYRDPVNRIIAMPAFVGGDCSTAGLKWIASFPGNLDHGLPRAHCVVVLNEADSGEPIACINSPTTSVIRTAAVSGAVLRRYVAARNPAELRVGICGFGPIGRAHADLIRTEFADLEPDIRVFDVREGLAEELDGTDAGAGVRVVSDWRHAHEDVDVFITCTTTPERYVDRATRPGSLMLNVSLRDFETSVFSQVDRFVVDDWTEVCRENTDIERMAEECGLTEDDVETLADVVVSDSFRSLREDEVTLVSPMGMACFDIAVGRRLHDQAVRAGVGTPLE